MSPSGGGGYDPARHAKSSHWTCTVPGPPRASPSGGGGYGPARHVGTARAPEDSLGGDVKSQGLCER